MTVQPIVVGTTNGLFDIIGRVLREVANRRSQRLALAALMTMSPHRLDDLGISHADVIDALNSRSSVGQALAVRRAARSRSSVTKRLRKSPGGGGLGATSGEVMP